MAKTSRNDTPGRKDLAPVGGAGNGATPDWLAQYDNAGDESLNTLKQYRILPRLKVIQAMTRAELRDKFSDGTVVIIPAEIAVADRDTPLVLVPVFFFPEFVKWADRKDKVSNSILERTLDPLSELAAKCKDPKRRVEGYGPLNAQQKPQYLARNVEQLTFVCMIADGDNKGLLVSLVFARGEYSKGTAFMNAVTMRRVGGRVAPLWSQRWSFHPAYRDRGDKKWWGIDFETPEQPYIEAGDVEVCSGLFKEMKTLYDDRRIASADDTEEEEGSPESSSEM